MQDHRAALGGGYWGGWCRCTGDEVSFEGARRDVRQVARVRCGRKIQGSRGGDRVDRLRNGAVLECGLGEVREVVDDDVAARDRAQIRDVGRELRLGRPRRGETQRGPGRLVLDDLEHRRPLVAAAGLAREYGDRRKLARRLLRGERIYAVG